MDPKSTRTLGKSGVTVTVLGCGGGPLGDMYTLLDNDEEIATVETAYELGITLFDTSPFHRHGLSEQRFGAALRDKAARQFRSLHQGWALPRATERQAATRPNAMTALSSRLMCRILAGFAGNADVRRYDIQ